MAVTDVKLRGEKVGESGTYIKKEKKKNLTRPLKQAYEDTFMALWPS